MCLLFGLFLSALQPLPVILCSLFYFLHSTSSFLISVAFYGWFVSSVWLCLVRQSQRLQPVSYMSPQSSPRLFSKVSRPFFVNFQFYDSTKWLFLTPYFTWQVRRGLLRLNSTSNVSTPHLSATFSLLRRSSQVIPVICIP